MDVGGWFIDSTNDESRCSEETSIPEFWRVRAGVGYVILEAEDEGEDSEGEDNKLLLLTTLVSGAPYDRSG